MSGKNGLPKYLFRMGDTFYARVAIPKQLRGFFSGKDIILRSLKTGDPKIAESRKDIEVGRIKAEFERLFNLDPFAAAVSVATVRWQMDSEGKQATLTTTEDTTSTIGALGIAARTEADPERRAAVEARQRAMLETSRAGMSGWQTELLSRSGRFAPLPIDVADPAAIRSWIRSANNLLEFLEGGGDATGSTPLHEMAAFVSGGELGEVAKAQVLQEIPAALLPRRARPYLAQARSGAVPDDDNITLGDLITRFFADDKRACMDPLTQRNYAIPVAIMKEVLGETTPVRVIRRDDVRKVQQVIRYLPAKARENPRYREMTWEQIADAAKADRESGINVPALKSSTRNTYIRHMGTIFAYALDEGKVEFNPALGLTVRLPEDRDEECKEPFTPEDLRAMFPRTYRLEGLNWVPLIMLYHGMRPTEAAQLDTADVILVDGVWAFDLTTETKGAVGSDRWGDKSLKNDRSTVRRIPIHQRLLDLGFLDYLQSRIAAGERKVFDVKGYSQAGYFESIRHEFTTWLDAVGVKRSNTTPHSLRHTWATASFRVVDDALRKIIGGWSVGKGVDVATYLHTNHLSMADMKAELDKVTFDVLTADEVPGRAHPGLIAWKRVRRGRRKATEQQSLKTKRLIASKRMV